MENKKHIINQLEAVQSILEAMKPEEREKFRDDLLSWLLFSGLENHNSPDDENSTQNLKGLSDEERELIKKLAQQTEALYRTLGKGRKKDQ